MRSRGQRYEQRLLEGEARLAAGAELAGLAFYEVDFDGSVAHVDDRLRDLCGVPADRRTRPAGPWSSGGSRSIRTTASASWICAGNCTKGRWKASPWSIGFCIRSLAKGGSTTLPESPGATSAGRTLKSFGVLRDITQTKRAEEALRDLSRRLILAHEHERALLARELHDDVTQRLAVLAIDVGRAELAAPHAAQANELGAVRMQLVRLSEDIHALAYQLHPSVLAELGLVEALRAECERRGRQGRLAVSLDLEPFSAVAGKDAELCLFRVAQEALTNVARHAGTDAARVTLRQADGGVLLAVRDEGVGFDPANSRPGRSLGLASMRERVHLVNGTLDIESTPGRGTTLVAWVPAHADAGRSP